MINVKAKGQGGSVFRSFQVALMPIVNETFATHKLFRAKSSMAILLYVWILSGAFLIMAFQSILLASLARVSYQKEINTPEEVLAGGKTVYVTDGTYLSTVVKESMNPTVRAIYKELVAEKGELLQHDVSAKCTVKSRFNEWPPPEHFDSLNRDLTLNRGFLM